MVRNILLAGLLLALLSVGLGAFGAHGLKQLVSADKVAIFETGVRYQFMHALALVLIAFFISQQGNPYFQHRGLLAVASFFLMGVLLFSGSLYLLSLQPLCSFDYTHFIGPVTPIGGLFFMLGWGVWIRWAWRCKVDK
ncbi:MAG: hypothetical protein RLZ56_410 [Bacteroidota bacterium]|jgi:uncharacterized membrane protein YgdD (TMEM256/DUF423 family)